MNPIVNVLNDIFNLTNLPTSTLTNNVLENNVEEIFKKYKLKRYIPDHIIDLTKKIKLTNKKNTYYVKNPFGTQKPPDFLILVNNLKPIKIECKSSKTLRPLWNCSLPNIDTIYIFYSGKIKKIFINLSKHIISNNTIDELTELTHKIKLLLNEVQKDKKEFFYYIRNMYVQNKNYEILKRNDMLNDTIIYIKTLFNII
jgi:hypothetical protein